MILKVSVLSPYILVITCLVWPVCNRIKSGVRLMAYKILLPFDGSKCSVKAAEYVAQIMAEGQDITCTVLFVTPFTRDFARFLGMTEDEYSQRIDELAAMIRTRVKHLFESKGLNVRTLLLEGDPVRVICEVAKNEEYDEIVMGSRGYTGIKKAFNGNFSQKIAKKAACSVKILK